MAKITFDIPKVIKAITDAVGDGTLGAAMALRSTMAGMGRRAGGKRFRSSPVGSPPMNQRGRMYGSMVAARTGPLSARAGSSIRPTGTGRSYPGVHETGGTIRPTTGKYLPVPLNAAARDLNEARGTRSLRSYALKLVVTKKKNLLLVGEDSRKTSHYATKGGKRVTKTDDSVPKFVLKKEVKIPPRPWARPALKKATPRMVRDFVNVSRKSLQRSGFKFQVSAT